jgi:hypothetical protein
MDHFPAEIWGEIFTFACVDDGRTGRALSLVSQFIHETSKPYKLQYIAVIGEERLRAFADLLEQTPSHLRHVKCFFLFYHSYYYLRTDLRVLKRILHAISSSVRIIHAAFGWARPFVLLPVSLPVLEELVVHGPIDIPRTVYDSIEFIALKYLSFTCNPAFLFANMLRLTPSLVNLRIWPAHKFLNAWSATAHSGFPTHIQRIFIHPPDIADVRGRFDLYNSLMNTLCHLADTDNRVSFLPPLQLDLVNMTPIEQIVATWNASAASIP